MTYNISNHFNEEFMISVTSFKSSSRQHDVHFGNEGLILSKIDDKAREYSKIDS